MSSKKWYALTTTIFLMMAVGCYFSFVAKKSVPPQKAHSTEKTGTHRSKNASEARRESNPPQWAPSTAPANVPQTSSAPAVFGLSGPVALDDVPKGTLRTELNKLPAGARNFALETLTKLHVPLNDVASLRVGPTGYLFYQCAPAPESAYLKSQARQAAARSTSNAETSGASVPIVSPPIRHSKPGATKVIYLDFNGQTISGTAWNLAQGSASDSDYRPAVASYVAKAFSIDADYTTFNDAEQAAIIRIWERVAEDYMPFDVDVTTEEPATFSATTGRILLTSSVDANGVSMPSSSTAAGVAFLNVFGQSTYVSTYSPALVYVDKEYYYSDYIAEAASHEMGHNLSLSHNGLLPTSTANEYYSGHGYGATSWGPIMGAPYNQSVTQWTKGEYYNANNTQDDLALIAGLLGYSPSPSTDTNASATALSGTLTAQGIIGRTGEADRYSFTSGVSIMSFTVSPYATLADKTGGNAGLQLQLYDASNTLIASSDPTINSAGATVTAPVAAGTYYVRVVGSGWGTPTANPPSGYTAYGSLGQYVLVGSSAAPTAPSFSSPPYATSVQEGQAPTFSTYASGNPTPQLKWQRLPASGSIWSDLSDGTSYSGTITGSLKINPAILSMSGDQFRCVATNIGGTATSTGATLTVSPATPPSFYYAPSAQSTTVGSSAYFSTGISGSSPLTLHWQRLPAGSGTWADLADGAGFSGTTSYYLSLTNVTLGMDGDKYRCIATNVAGTATSGAATLSVTPVIAPSISSVPSTLSVNYGDSIYISPTVTGTAPFTIQWYKNGAALSGYTGQYFSKYNATTADSGSYTMTASNSAGTATSSAVVVTVKAPIGPAISQQPVSIDVAKGYSASFAVSAAGSPQLAYQWYKDGVAIQSATYASYSIGSVQTSDSGQYTVRISNDAGNIVSQAAALTVLPSLLPTVSIQSGTTTISILNTYLNLSASIYGTAPFTYQWYKDGAAIPNADGSTYYKGTATAADAGVYTLQVTNDAGTAMSNDALVVWSAASVPPWLDSVQLNHTIYFLASTPGRIMRYDLDHESWLPMVYLPESKVPTAFLPTADGVFVAYGPNLIRLPLNLVGTTETVVSTSGSMINMLFAHGSLVYYTDGTTAKTYDQSTLVAGPSFQLPYPWLNGGGGLSRAARPALQSDAALGYTTRPSSSPNDIIQFTFAQDGTIPTCTNAPYNGDFRVGTREYLSPDQKSLFDNSGVIYSTKDLTYTASMGRAFDDITFIDTGAPVALRGQMLYAQGGNGYATTGTFQLSAANYAVYSLGSTVFSFAAPTSNTTNPGVTKVTPSDFSLPGSGTRGSPSNKMFSVENSFIDAKGVIHLMSRTEQGIVRWDTQTQTFLSTLPLRGRPLFTNYAPAIGRVALLYGTGELTDIFPGVDGIEQTVGNVPESNTPFALIAMDDLTAMNIRQSDTSADLRIVVGPLGELNYLSNWGYYDVSQAWSSVNRRLYATPSYTSNGEIQYLTVPDSGSLAATPTSASGVVTPLRLSADETLVLSGNKVLTADLQNVGTLANAVSDGVWLSDGLYTIRVRPDGTEMQKWTRVTYAKTGSLSLPGVPVRIFKVSDNRLAVVTLVSGYAAFHLVSSDLSLISSTINGAIPPVITSQPASQSVALGFGVSFKVTAAGAAPIIYQWQKNGVAINGAVSETFQINAVAGSDAGSYSVVVTGSGSSVTSNPAVLTTLTPASKKSVANDFDGDGQDDLIWQNTVTGERSFWLMNGTILKQGVSLGAFAPDWTIVGSGDFNGDGKADLLWQNTITGERTIWLMNGTTFTLGVDLGTYSTDLMIVASGDFNGDGQTDIVWQNISTGERGVWLMNGTKKISEVSLGTIPTAWSIAGTGDFNGDGKVDLVWQNAATGERSIWLMNGTTLSAGISLGVVPKQFQIVGTGDYNHDGKTDLLWTDTETGNRSIWLMNGTVHTSTVAFTMVSVEWSLARPIFLTAQTAHADFNADGQTDIISQNNSTGERTISFMNGSALTSTVSLGSTSTDWVISGTGDFNHDDKPDIVWTNKVTGERTVWLMDGTTMLSNVPLTTLSPQWTISAIGDFNYDGKPDIVWTNTATGERAIWLMNGTVFGSGVSLGTISTAWKIVATADLNGDGKTDLIWQNSSTGESSVWLMNGGSFTSGVVLDTLPARWSIVGTGDFNGDGKADLLLQNTVTGERVVRLMNRTTFLSTVSLGTSSTDWSVGN